MNKKNNGKEIISPRYGIISKKNAIYEMAIEFTVILNSLLIFPKKIKLLWIKKERINIITIASIKELNISDKNNNIFFDSLNHFLINLLGLRFEINHPIKNL